MTLHEPKNPRLLTMGLDSIVEVHKAARQYAIDLKRRGKQDRAHQVDLAADDMLLAMLYMGKPEDMQ